MKVLRVALEVPVAKLFDYLGGEAASAELGDRVVVPFGARERAGSFLALAQTPELACEVTLQPLSRFALDAAILFSDILTVPDAMGLGLHFVEGEGPKFERPVVSAADVANQAQRVHDVAQLR